MELEKVFKLIDAGYTKEEIQAFEAPADPDPEVKEAPEAKETPEPAPEPKPQPNEKDQILAALERLTNAVMQKNLNVTTASTTKQDPGDILAKVIAPPKKEK